MMAAEGSCYAPFHHGTTIDAWRASCYAPGPAVGRAPSYHSAAPVYFDFAASLQTWETQQRAALMWNGYTNASGATSSMGISSCSVTRVPANPHLPDNVRNWWKRKKRGKKRRSPRPSSPPASHTPVFDAPHEEWLAAHQEMLIAAGELRRRGGAHRLVDDADSGTRLVLNQSYDQSTL